MNIQTPTSETPNASNEDIRVAQDKVIARLAADPASALTTNVLTARVGEGLTCAVEQGKFSTVMDLGPAMGGAARGPGPGFFAKAGLAGCVAIAVKMTAAREGIDIRSVDLRLETDSDDLALFGIGDNSAAPLETRIMLEVKSSAADGVIEALVARVLECSPWFLAFRDPRNVTVKTVVNKVNRSNLP
ncbi:MAG: OsmC family protein [Sulfitobacter sp.]